MPASFAAPAPHDCRNKRDSHRIAEACVPIGDGTSGPSAGDPATDGTRPSPSGTPTTPTVHLFPATLTPGSRSDRFCADAPQMDVDSYFGGGDGGAPSGVTTAPSIGGAMETDDTPDDGPPDGPRARVVHADDGLEFGGPAVRFPATRRLQHCRSRLTSCVVASYCTMGGPLVSISSTSRKP